MFTLFYILYSCLSLLSAPLNNNTSLLLLHFCLRLIYLTLGMIFTLTSIVFDSFSRNSSLPRAYSTPSVVNMARIIIPFDISPLMVT